MTVLVTEHLTKKYKTQIAVNDVNMRVEKKDIYGFIGENGAGKTTIMRMITGLAAPTSGEFTLFQTNSESPEIAAARRKISAVVETPSVYLNLNAKDNLKMQCIILGIATEKNDNILEQVGLTEAASTNKKAKDFSLGMRQRLGIAMALVGNPEFIILDEPMNGLDPQGIIEIRELIQKLNKENDITFLISSHILYELSLIATKYGFISHGKLICEITADELHEECHKFGDGNLEDYYIHLIRGERHV